VTGARRRGLQARALKRDEGADDSPAIQQREIRNRAVSMKPV